MSRKQFRAFIWSEYGSIPFDVKAAADFESTGSLFGIPIVWANAGKKVQK